MVVVVAASESDAARRESRMSADEREAVLRRLQKDPRVDPVCVPSETPPTNNSKYLQVVNGSRITEMHENMEMI